MGLISKENLIKILKDVELAASNCATSMRSIINDVEKMPDDKPEQKWIPIEEHPKQRMRLIDADEFISELTKLYEYAGWDQREIHFSLSDIICNIEMMPTIVNRKVIERTCYDCKYGAYDAGSCMRKTASSGKERKKNDTASLMENSSRVG